MINPRLGLLGVLVSLFFSTTVFSATTYSAFPITGSANNPQVAQAFDRQIVPFMQRWNVPGASLTVVKNGQVVAQRAYGWANKENNIQVAPGSLFRIASASKTFAAVTVLKLIQEGKLHLNDRVFNLLSDLKPLPGRPLNPRIYDITVQNLLQMSSGWFTGARGHLDPMFGPWPKNFREVLSPELPPSCQTAVRFMMSQPLRRRPGSQYAYSNLDYCLLGLVVNKVTGSPYGYEGYERYVKQQVLAPAGIFDMQIGSTRSTYQLPGEVRYYKDTHISAQELADSFYLPYGNTELLQKNFANGGWVATSKDLSLFVNALAQGRILNPVMLSIMQQRPSFVAKDKVTYYTMGGIIDYLNGQRYWIQTGSFTGSNALVVTKPNGTTMAIIFNYRPEGAIFLAKFRPQLRRLMISSGF